MSEDERYELLQEKVLSAVSGIYPTSVDIGEYKTALRTLSEELLTMAAAD